MTDILTTTQDNLLFVESKIESILENNTETNIIETQKENLLESVVENVVLLTNGVQVIPGVPAGFTKILKVDPSRPIAYVGFQYNIMRLDYTIWPPTKSSFTTTNLEIDWLNREELEYN